MYNMHELKYRNTRYSKHQKPEIFYNFMRRISDSRWECFAILRPLLSGIQKIHVAGNPGNAERMHATVRRSNRMRKPPEKLREI